VKLAGLAASESPLGIGAIIGTGIYTLTGVAAGWRGRR
jgi:hypothetical protein